MNLPRVRPGIAVGLVLGAVLDAAFGDPARHHPVALFGAAATRAERALWARSRGRGAVYALACAGPVAGAAWGLQRAAARWPAAATMLTAAAAWAVLGGASLGREAAGVARALDTGDLAAARARLPSLCGRDPDGLGPAELARAVVESVAENTCDAVVAPLVWGAVAGPAGLLGFRAVNTLDAMVGHKSPRHYEFGWAAARLDDVMNVVPARLTALLAALAAPAVGASPRAVLGVTRRDGGAHPSPNAGRCEAAFAGALGITLGGTNVYQGRAERRGTLGDGRSPDSRDIRRAVRLSRLITIGATLTSAGLAALLGQRRGEPAGARS